MSQSHTPVQRAGALAAQLQIHPTAGASKKDPNDVVIVSAVRTAITKARNGEFSQSFIEDMLAPCLKEVITRTKINPASVGDIVVGCVLGNNGMRATEARMAGFYAGFPDTVPVHMVNRQCSSGLQAVAHVAANIKAGYYDIGIGAGMESMTQAPMKQDVKINPRVNLHKQAKACLLPMGITSENVVSKYGITREEQDQLAVMSHKRAAAAIKAGKFKSEIVPVDVTLTDPKTGEEKKLTVAQDGGVRANTTMETLAKLPPAFKKDGGSTTAGNSSQVSDGAAAVLLMRRSVAEKLNVPVLGVFRSFAVVGCDPAVMGIGPAVAIPPALKSAGIAANDVDLFEINEAFASQAVYCVKKLGLSWDKVNVNGGAIALGHPLGATGARQIATLLPELQRRNARFGVVSMCIGTGMGAAAVIERE